jgi:hypothetical protein
VLRKDPDADFARQRRSGARKAEPRLGRIAASADSLDRADTHHARSNERQIKYRLLHMTPGRCSRHSAMRMARSIGRRSGLRLPDPGAGHLPAEPGSVPAAHALARCRCDGQRRESCGSRSPPR